MVYVIPFLKVFRGVNIYRYTVFNKAIKERCFYVYLFNFLVMDRYKGNKEVDSFYFNYRCEGFFIVNPFFLFKSLDKLACFIPLNIFISTDFKLVYLFFR